MLTTKVKQVKLANQLQTARDVFSTIAEKEVEANFKIADALTTIGIALEKLADNDKKRLENEKLILEIYTKVIDKL